MRKLVRLTVAQLLADSTYSKISSEEMRFYTGGDGVLTDEEWKNGGYGQKNNCLYDCISYMGRQYGYDQRPEWYCGDYGKGYNDPNDDWYGSGCDKDMIYGPDMYLNGQPSENIYKYMSTYFDTEGSGWVTESDTQNVFQGASDSQQVLGMFRVTGEDGLVGYHAVVLQSYANGKYTYYDPSTNKYGTIDKDSVVGSIVTSGSRKNQ